jgi:general secretion pathway protein K
MSMAEFFGRAEEWHGHLAHVRKNHRQDADATFDRLDRVSSHQKRRAPERLALALQRKKTRAAAIMLSLWALFLLSAMVISWALDIDTRLTNSGSANRALEAEALACSGAEIALHPNVKAGSSLLRGNFGPNQSYETRVTGEGGRLNVNLLVAGQNPQFVELLRRYLEVKGVDLNERDHMIDCLLDWVDPDNLVRLNGAEDDPGYKAANKPLTNLDELKRVRGWEEFTSRPDWDAELTIMSTSPQIDVVWAPRNVLLALPGMTEGLVDRYLTMRRGPDGMDGTDDDGIKSLNDFQVAMGLTTVQFEQIAPFVTLNGPILRIVSVGRSGTATRSVRMVVSKVGNAIQLKSWKEL